MKILILGATGKLGHHLVESCLARGHEVTAAARDPGRLSPGWAGRLRTARVDIMETSTLEAALAGQEAAISAAGHVADGQRFVDLFDAVATAAERVLGRERRVWMLAGAAILDIPRAGRTGIDLPFVPKLYRPHLENWRRLQRSKLDWALMCPGPMVAGDSVGLCASVDAWPFSVGAWARYAPPVALSLLMKSKLPQLTVPYRAVADFIVGQLEPGGIYCRKRVGLGWADARR